MKIYFDLDYEEAVALRVRLLHETDIRFMEVVREDLIDAINNAIQNEDEKRAELDHERLMESGGVDDSAYCRDMKDAGLGHLLR